VEKVTPGRWTDIESKKEKRGGKEDPQNIPVEGRGLGKKKKKTLLILASSRKREWGH